MVSKRKTVRTSALLESTEWHIGVEHVNAVDPNGSSLEFVGSQQSTVEVSGENSSSETVKSVVGLADDISLVYELDNASDGPKNLLLDDLHLWLRVRENCWLDGSYGRVSQDDTKNQVGRTSMK